MQWNFVVHIDQVIMYHYFIFHIFEELWRKKLQISPFDSHMVL